MMLRILIITLSALFISPGAWAVCTLDRGTPTSLMIPSQVIHVSADAPVDLETPIAQYDSPPLGKEVSYIYCIDGSEYGKRTLNLSGQDPATKIFPTNVSGIGIKLLASNGTAFGNFPSVSYHKLPVGSPEGRLTYTAANFYRIQFFKTSTNLRLVDPAGDTVLPPNKYGYNYVLTANPASYVMDLSIGEIKIISTPACTTDGTKTVDFNNVTRSLLNSSVRRDLNFSIVCKSDYGSYSAKSSIIANTPSSDASYIRVEDAMGNKDSMGIKITDSSGKAMKVNGSTSEQKNSTSNGPAEFAWNATLVATNSAAPAGGAFSARAEIVFDIQ